LIEKVATALRGAFSIPRLGIPLDSTVDSRDKSIVPAWVSVTHPIVVEGDDGKEEDLGVSGGVRGV